MRDQDFKFRRSSLIVALFLPALLILALPFWRPDEVSVFFLMIGRFHPLILHFPIVLIILALLFEIASRYNLISISKNVIAAVLIASALSTLASVGAGFFLYASGEYSGRLMEQHFWAGAITGSSIFITVLLFFLHQRARRIYPVYLMTLLFSNAAVAYTSHLGGSITHGQDYLTEYFDFMMNREIGDDSDDAGMRVFENMIAPIFEAKCVSCHNATKAKGGFLMTGYQDILKGGDSGNPSVVANAPEKSELLKRVLLPDTVEEHMPPDGNTPMTPREIDLLKFWIESGASEKLSVTDVQVDDSARTLITDLLPAIKQYQRKADIRKMKREVLKNELREVARQLSVTILSDSLSDEHYFTLAMKFPPPRFTNDDFSVLSPYYEAFSKASLVASGINDDGLYYISQMVNLKALYLQKTKLNGSGLTYLKKLPQLEVLNLSYTQVNDKALIDLLQFPKLKVVYLFRTNTSKAVADALMKNKPELTLLYEEGPYL